MKFAKALTELTKAAKAKTPRRAEARDPARIVILVLGIPELVKVAAFAETVGCEVLDFVKHAPDVTTCEMVGRFLSYNVSLDVDGTLWLWVSSADDADLPQRVLSSVAAADWKIVARTISALEFSQVASVANRPFEIVDRFGERWVIA